MFKGAAVIAGNVAMANLILGDEPGALVAGGFAAVMEAGDSLDSSAQQTAVTLFGDTVISSAFEAFGVPGQIANMGFTTFYDSWVDTLFNPPSSPPPRKQSSPIGTPQNK